MNARSTRAEMEAHVSMTMEDIYADVPVASLDTTVTEVSTSVLSLNNYTVVQETGPLRYLLK